MTNEFPKHDLLAADAWPWNYLLIDGASLPEAERLLYQACDYPEHMNLFAGPTYGEIADVGPLLVQITFEHPLVQRLIEADFTQEWGYLLRSALDLSALTHWFRRFITARHPSGVDFFLWFANPAAASVLFGDAGAFRRAGAPIEDILLPDSLEWSWQYIRMPTVMDDAITESLTLSEQDIEALTKVDQRNILKKMITHLDEFFPDWAFNIDRKLQSATLFRLLGLARQANYVSERALTHWINVFGFLRPVRVPEDLPEPIQAFLSEIPPNSDAERAARKVALLARQFTTQHAIHENSGTE